MIYDAYQRNEIEEARKDLAQIFDVLRGQSFLWHRTSIESLKAILRHGTIEPNHGQFSYTYPQSEKCYGRELGAVCLFDFDTEPVEDILLQACKWQQFLTDSGSATILIRIDRKALKKKNLILPNAVQGSAHVLIPHVEAWHKGSISTSAFRGYLAVRKGSGKRI